MIGVFVRSITSADKIWAERISILIPSVISGETKLNRIFQTLTARILARTTRLCPQFSLLFLGHVIVGSSTVRAGAMRTKNSSQNQLQHESTMTGTTCAVLLSQIPTP